MSSDQDIGPNLPESPEPTGQVANSTPPPAEGIETRRFAFLLRRRRRSSTGIRRVRVSAADAEDDEPRRFGLRWRNRRAQRVYSLKLYNALRRSPQSSFAGVRVRDTADRVLAVAARGTTRWSRAILVSRLGAGRKTAAVVRGVERRRVGRRNPAEEENRVRVLARLVPGCRRTALPELLNETADYIAALEMQVRAMTALAEILAESHPSDQLGSACLSR